MRTLPNQIENVFDGAIKVFGRSFHPRKWPPRPLCVKFRRRSPGAVAAQLPSRILASAIATCSSSTLLSAPLGRLVASRLPACPPTRHKSKPELHHHHLKCDDTFGDARRCQRSAVCILHYKLVRSNDWRASACHRVAPEARPQRLIR